VSARGPALLLASVLAAGLAACGQKGDPKPPLRPAPGPLSDVSARRIDDRVELRFTIPNANEDRSTPSAIERVEIYALASAPGAPRPAVTEIQVEANLKGRVDVRQDAPAPPAPPRDAAVLPRVAADTRPAPGERATFLDTITAVRAAPAPPVLSYVIVGIIGGRRRASARLDVPIALNPPAPTEVTLTWNEQSLTLGWRPAAETQAFRVYEADASGRINDAQPPADAPIAAASFSSPVRFGVERCFAVRAVHVDGPVTIEGPASPPVCRTPEDTFPPPAPAGVNGIAGDGAVTLIWPAVEAPDLAGYLILRSETAGATLSPLSTLVTATTYVDRAVTPGTTYWYEVVAVDSSPRQNRSTVSNRVTVTAR
jgi:hypothetical protein